MKSQQLLINATIDKRISCMKVGESLIKKDDLTRVLISYEIYETSLHLII